MNGRLKVIIADDGSSYADAAIDDLRRAGLPREGDALVFGVADVLVKDSPLDSVTIKKALSARWMTALICLLTSPPRLISNWRERYSEFD